MRTRTIGAVVCAALLAAAPAAAASRFRVVESKAAAHGYVETEGMLSGSFVRPDGSTGTYEAPVGLLHPAEPKRCSGLGVADLANAAFFNFPLLRDGFWNMRFARSMLGDAFLMARGVVYAAPTWDKKATDQMARGRIERREDGRRIVEDASAFLRDPGSVEIVDAPAGFVAPACGAETLVGYGFSDSASLLRTYFLPGGPRSPFDAAFIHAAGATCWDFTAGQAVVACRGLRPDLGAKVISLDAETEVQIQDAANARQELRDYRHYELAGVAHLPKAEVDLMAVAREAADEDPAFATAVRATSRFQNPQTMAPPTRAAFQHLLDWTTKGTTPPENAHLDGTFDARGQFRIARDSDGNALGGIRLPWLETALPDGSRVGAALGVHDGVDPAGGFVLGGRYECFGDIHERYPTHRAYRRLVASGADHAAREGWILDDDRRAYSRAAARLDLRDVECPPWRSGFEPALFAGGLGPAR